MKTCSRCGIEQAVDSFHRQANAKDGRQSRCRDCVSETGAIRRPSRPKPTMEERFWSKVIKETEERDPGLGPCWIWTGRIGEDGYGYFQTGDRVTEKGHRAPTQAHIVSARLASKPIPDGKVWDHFCRQRSCVNTDHLEAVVQRENIRRGVSLVADYMEAKTYKCSHPKDSEHSYYRPDGKGQFCGTCARARGRKRTA